MKDQRRPREEAPQSVLAGGNQAEGRSVDPEASGIKAGSSRPIADVATTRSFLDLLFGGLAEGEEGRLPPKTQLPTRDQATEVSRG